MTTPSIAITGATGYIGSQLLRSLDSKGVTGVRVVARNGSGCLDAAGFEAEVVRGDILDQASLEEAFTGIDTVFHSAGLISYTKRSRGDLYRVNVLGTRHVVDACLKAGVRRLVAVSSIAAAGASADGSPVTESAQFQDWQHRNGYMESKHLAELEVLRGAAEGLEALMVSPGVVIGRDGGNPCSRSSSNEVLRLIYEGRIPLHPAGGTGFVDVRDVAEALVAAWQRGKSGERYLVVGHNLAFGELFGRIGTLRGARTRRPVPIPRVLGLMAGVGGELYSLMTGRPSFISMEAIRLAARMASYSNTKSTEELQVTYRPLEETLLGAVT
ncbi:NAD-dependent epimerase/dehydratase family protein [Chlorobium sp. N1]|uniref:NAD-dependent epimerase/dehydratase family protein n=1 Tax=Chlorobium sp. N1 TaxID=2491138 RepID=UPI00103AE573|nr:NAD-dependent epimerase/dehydratase family protein [Chlorobium sp. N1]TCD47853.1 NAD-dependent epimerase/dehydratase family protein [Chlorobium sp. N1]